MQQPLLCAAAQTTDNPHDQGESSWSDAETARVRELCAQYSGPLGRYHGGPPGQPHQPGTGPGFEVSAQDLADSAFRFFGSGRTRMPAVE